MADEISYDDLAAGVEPAASPEPTTEPSYSPEPAASPEGAAAEPVQAESEPEKSLDELLAEFDRTAQQEQLRQYEQAYQGAQWQTEQAQQYAAQVEQQAQAERDRRDGLELIKEIKGNLPIQDQAVGYFLDGQLLANPQLLELWNNRHNDPQSFQRARTMLGKELYKTFSRLPDPDATETRRLVSDAVFRGASNDSPPAERAPDWGSMTDNELREYTRKNFGFV
jgi:hypothetical protein